MHLKNTVLWWWVGGLAIMLLANVLLAQFMGATMFVPFIAFTGLAGPILRRQNPIAIA